VEQSHDYADLQRLMVDAHAMSEPAEAHGALVGALCAGVPYSADDWLNEVLPDGGSGGAADRALRAVYDTTWRALSAGQFEFSLLLPDDAQDLEARAESLGQWCTGFLYGLGTAGGPDPEKMPGDAGEILRDLAQITRAGVDLGDGLEGNQTALEELIEYVRMGAQLVYEELGEKRGAARPPDVALH